MEGEEVERNEGKKEGYNHTEGCLNRKDGKNECKKDRNIERKM